MNHLLGFCLQIHYFSPIVFQCSALTLVSQCGEAGYLLEATALGKALSGSSHLISNSSSRGVQPKAPGLQVAQDGYECGPTQNHKYT